MGPVLLRIGEFARLVQLPVRTVRYYGDVGLLPPSEVDPRTSYRFYGLDRVEHARRLLALKEIGLPLEEIGRVLNDALSPAQFRSLLEAHVADLEADLARTGEQLDRARSQLAQLEQRLEQSMPDVTVKTTEPVRLVVLRDEIGGVEEIAALFPRLFATVDPTVAIGPAATVYHHFAEDGTRIDVEVAIPVPDEFEPGDGATTRVLEAVEVASLTHHGAFNRLHEAHAELLTWIDENGYQAAGPSYEWNLVCTPPVTQDDETYVTEIQIEVTKR